MNDSITFRGKVLSPVTESERLHVEKALQATGHTAQWNESSWGVTTYSDTSDAKGPAEYWSFIAHDAAQVQAIEAWLKENPYEPTTP